MKTLGQMTIEIRTLNTEKGWRTGDNTYGDYEALLQSEIAEMTENFRDHRLDTYTVPDGPKAGKPDDVGSEAADVLIRLLDMCDVFPVRLGRVLDFDRGLDQVVPAEVPEHFTTFTDHVNWLHKGAARIDLGAWSAASMVATFLSQLVAVCEKYGIHLDAEYERKMAYNWTRPYQHGGRTLSGNGRVPA